MNQLKDMKRKQEQQLVMNESQELKLKMLQFDYKVKVFEFYFIHFIIEKNLSYCVGERLLKFLKKFGTEPSIVANSSLNKKKISENVRDVFQPFVQETIFHTY